MSFSFVLVSFVLVIMEAQGIVSWNISITTYRGSFDCVKTQILTIYHIAVFPQRVYFEVAVAYGEMDYISNTIYSLRDSFQFINSLFTLKIYIYL